MTTHYLACSCILYADDTTFLSVDKDLTKVLSKNEATSEKSLTWLEGNKFYLNKSKTEVIHFHLRNELVDLNTSNSVQLLGIHLDTKLNWSTHTEHLCRKLSRVLFLIRKLKSVVGQNTLIKAYYALFHSLLQYGIILWGNSSGAQNVFKCQKKALRSIKGVADIISCKPFFKELKIMTVPSLYIHSCLIYVKNNLAVFDCRNDIHHYNTRHKDDLNNPHVRLTITQKNFKYASMKLYNLLLQHVKLMPYKKNLRSIVKHG